MLDPGLDAALQRAVLAALRGRLELVAYVGAPPNDRIFDRVPQSGANGAPLYPYITLGEDVIADDGGDIECFASSNCLVTVHVWSRAVGRAEAKIMGGYVRAALDRLIPIDGHSTVAGGFETAIWRASPDTLETEGILSFRYLVDSQLE